MNARGITVIVALLMAPGVAGAAQWCMVGQSSWLGFTAAWEGQSFQGRFGRFEAAIRFDPDDLASAEFLVDIPVASASTGNAERDEGMAEAEWFDYARFPTARFQATAFSPLGDDRYLASGQLRLKGVSRDTQVEFTWRRQDPGALLEGGARLDRTDFGIGSGDWADEEFVAHEVIVSFRLELVPCEQP